MSTIINHMDDQAKWGFRLGCSPQKLHELQEALDAAAIIAVTDRNGIITEVNEGFCQISKYTRDELVGRSHAILNSGYHSQSFFSTLWETIRQGRIWQGEVRNRAKDGSFYWTKSTIVPFLDEEGIPYQYIVIRADITEQKSLEEALLSSRESLTTLLNAIPDFVCLKDAEGRWVEANHYAIEVFGLDPDSYKGKTDAELLGHVAGLSDTVTFCNDTDNRAREKGTALHSEEIFIVPSGELLVFDLIKVPLFEKDGRHKGVVVIGRDISARKRAENMNDYLANSDPLTHIPNRRLFVETLSKTIVEASAGQEPFALLYLDLDRFKYVNDTLGHPVGDKLLQAFCDLLILLRRKDDFIARLGGDEFAIVMKGIESRQEVADYATSLLERLNSPIQLEEHELYVTTSIGICYYPADGLDAQTLMKNADAALNRAKEEGKNRYHFFNYSINAETTKAFSIETDLRHALNKGQFVLYYQPRVNATNGEIVGAEALIRWQHPLRGLVPPSDFIPIAEETGFIIPIGHWVLEEACQAINRWEASGVRAVPISVNISAKGFMEENLSSLIQCTLERHRLASSQIELEITESSFIQEPEIAKATMLQLAGLGLKLSLDDFGTGYSSLSYLTQYRLHTLKIDRSFIKDLDRDEKVRTITTGIIQIAKGLRMEVVAEGVETKEQLQLLREYGCDQVQGYYYSKPVPELEFRRLLELGKLE